MEIWRCQVPPLTLTLLDAMDVSNLTTTMSSRTTNISNATNWTSLDQTELGLEELLVLVADNHSLIANSTLDPWGDEDTSCGEWQPAQHNIFQLSSFLFAAAFVVPRKFKLSVLLLRILLCIGFLVSALWSGIHVCTPDMIAWNLGLAAVNLLHAIILACRFLPPALSIELTELYVRMFKPLKVSRKHFKELTREASLLHLSAGECYAIEESTPADERLSILLKGKLKVTCDGMHLHFINGYQFIDSPEWEAGHETSDDLFQVTITAEEESMYLCWPKLRMDRVLRHRPMLRTILSNLIGRDITQKLYSLNEQLGAALLMNANKKAAKCESWRHVMTRSLSVDAVTTGTKGHVRSDLWRQMHNRCSSLVPSDTNQSPVRKEQQCWIPIVANQFLAESPFVNLPQTPPLTEPNSPPELVPVPVIVPTLPPPPAAMRPLRRPREVKFDESKV